ncbi:MAG: hypothetical protein WCW31_05145 [Patescibacteria group bacterium]|jgi:hypothetical protein
METLHFIQEKLYTTQLVMLGTMLVIEGFLMWREAIGTEKGTILISEEKKAEIRRQKPPLTSIQMIDLRALVQIIMLSLLQLNLVVVLVQRQWYLAVILCMIAVPALITLRLRLRRLKF